MLKKFDSMIDQNVENRIKVLLALKITNKLSVEQEKELRELSRLPGVQTFIDTMKEDYLINEIRVIQNFDDRKSTVWDNMKPKIEFRRKVLTIWQRMAIAASFVLIIGIGAYLYFTSFSKTEQQVATTTGTVQDILPPEGTAFLTLADGRKIALDGSSKSGLANQGGSEVKQNGAEGLVYEQGAGAQLVYNTVTTPKGVMYTITLADGTRCWLNTASSIKYPAAFVGDERRVVVTGEAYFEVAKDAKRPFVVNADNSDIKVLGTSFNVNAYPNEPAVRTTLLEGKVEVTVPGPGLREVLKPGQQASATRDKAGLALSKNVDLDEVVSWKMDKFMFQGEGATIRDIMKQLERYYDIEVDFQGVIPDDHFVATMPRSLPISRILQVLQKTERIKFRIESGKVIVLPWNSNAR